MDEGRDPGLESTRPIAARPSELRATALHRSRVEDAPIFKVLAAIADAVSASEVYEALVDRVAEAVDASSAGLWLADGDGLTATLVRARGYSADAVRAIEVLQLHGQESSPALDCIRRAAPLWIPSQAAMYEGYPHLQSVAVQPRTYRVCCLPLSTRGRVLGALCLTIEAEGEASESEKDFLLLVAKYATQAIERLRLYQETLDAQTRAEQLYRFAESVVAADRVETVYEAALASIEAALGVRRAAILTYDEQKVMRFRAWRKLSDQYRAAVDGHSPWQPGEASPSPVLVSDALADPAWASYADVFRAEGIGALAFFPLLARGRLLGKLMLYHDQPHTFTPTELGIVRAIGFHLGSVIARFSAWAQLEETVRYNELFAGMLAHDLRSPLSAVMISAQLLVRRHAGEPASDKSVAKPASSILTSGQRMNTMITQLLDFTQSRAGGGIRIERREVSLDELREQAVGELELVRPEWTIRCESAGNLVGCWDPGRLVQVLSNVIANAGQHGQKGEPITVKLDGSREERVVLEVHNRGAVSPSVLPSLFDPFRTTRYRRGQSSGLGLGLFIVREIVRAHRGTVDVASSEEAGTTVSISLPRT